MAVILDFGLRIAAIDSCGLGNALLEKGILAFVGAGDAGSQVADVGVGRNIGKRNRDLVVGDPLPRTVIEVR